MIEARRQNVDQEPGVILILTAMLLFGLFMIAALAIDFSQMSINMEQGTQTAKFAGLSALQAYTNSSRDLTRAQRLEVARQQANAVSGYNLGMTMGGQNTADTLTSSGTGDGPQLIAGKYYAEVPAAYCSQPCAAGETTPCFVPLADVNLSCEPPGTTVNNVQPNSFRILGKYFSDLRTIFARLVGAGSYTIPVDIVAAFTPRRGMFLVDISASTFRETHWYAKTAPEYPSFYSYYRQPDNPTAGSSFYDSGPGSWPDLLANRGSPPVGAPSPSNPAYRTLHYKSDYAIVSSGAFPTATPAAPAYTGKSAANINLLTDANFTDPTEGFDKRHPNPAAATPYPINISASQHSGVFRVDTFRDANYKGPEPFNTIFQGLNSAVSAFKDRAVTGDRLGIVFFDEKLTWPRVINLTADFSYIEKFTDLSTLNNNSFGLQRVLRHGIFPSKDSKSNIMMAASEALRQFDAQQISNASSVDFMVYFGDGLANCVANTAALGAGANACEEDYTHYKQAITELRTFARSTLLPRHIAFNVILMGSHVGPHVLNIGDAQNNCYTDTEARNLELPFVEGATGSPTAADWKNMYDNMSAQAPFYQVNADMYQIARLTGGIWAPVRPYDPAKCNPACTSSHPTKVRFSCNETANDVDDYIKDEIMNSNPYMIVPGRQAPSS